MSAIDKIIANVESRFRLAQSHMLFHEQKAGHYSEQAKNYAHDVARYAEALGVLQEIRDSEEIVE